MKTALGKKLLLFKLGVPLGAVVATAATFLIVFASSEPVPPTSAVHCPQRPGTQPAPGAVPSATSTAPPVVNALRRAAPFTSPAPADSAGMPYELPTTHGKTGLEEPVDEAGRVPSTGRPVTWAKHAALGAAYRDYYITMLWRYAEWDFNGRARNVDQQQFGWFAAKPRLVLVTNPRTHKSIIAAVIEAGPGPWVSFGGDRDGQAHAWPGWQRGIPDGYTGIVSGFPPTAIAALGARTGYASDREPDELTYQWAPDQNAIPGPTTTTGDGAEQVGYRPAPTTCAAPSGVNSAAVTTGPVELSGPTVAIPSNPYSRWRGTDYAGTVIQAPNQAVARAIAAGLQYLGTPYVWGGGSAAGPDNGCARADCLPLVGFDCSGLTLYAMAAGGISIPSYSGAQRDQSVAVPWDQALPGDLIGYPRHISIYLGTVNGVRLQLEAPSTGDFVKVSGVHRSDVDPVVYRWWNRGST